MVFARAVVLVEDESQQEFLVPIADTLGVNLNENGISVLSVAGEQGYKEFMVLLRALAIPFVALKDRVWGDDRQYPPTRFFSFGMELEEYLDRHGLAHERQAAIAEFGKSKARVAGILGSSVRKEQVPALFSELLATAAELATGEPATG